MGTRDNILYPARRGGRGALWLALLAVLFLALPACTTADMEGRPVDVGTSHEGYLKEGRYHNDFYHFTWKAPQGWNPVKPTSLEAPAFRADPNQGYMFGWANEPLQAESRFLVFPPGAETPAGCDLAACAKAVAESQGWKAVDLQPGRWQGRPSLEAYFGLGALSPPDQLLAARFVRQGQDLLVFSLKMPATSFDTVQEALRDLLLGLRFTQTVPVKAPLAGKPDLAHVVKQTGETMTAIAQWYTGNPQNAARILDYNHLSPTAVLSINQEIQIPGDMVTNPKPMPPPAKKKVPAKKHEPSPDPALAESPPPPVPPRGVLLEPIAPR